MAKFGPSPEGQPRRGAPPVPAATVLGAAVCVEVGAHVDRHRWWTHALVVARERLAARPFPLIAALRAQAA